MYSVSVQAPSRSSCSKLVVCWERVPPLSTTASSSFLCGKQTCTNTHLIHYSIRVIKYLIKNTQLELKPQNICRMYPKVKCLLTWCCLTVEGTMNKHIIQLSSMVAMETNYSLVLKRKGYHLRPNRFLFIMGTINDPSTVKVLFLFSRTSAQKDLNS